MEMDWRDPETARRWDAAAYAHNPTRREQLDILVSVLAGLWQPGAGILDLGCGSGQVEEVILRRLPDARLVGVDSSPAMLDLARARLAGREASVRLVTHDLADLASAPLPEQPFHFALAVQSLHHLAAADMRAAYGTIFALLRPGGLFLLQDRLAVEDAEGFAVLRQVWARQDRLHGSSALEHEGADFVDHQRRVRARGDRPVLLQEHLAWLRAAGFRAACLHLDGNRGLIAAVRPA